MLWILFTLLVFLVILDAIGDATRDNRKKISHIIQFLFVVIILLLVIYYPGITWKDHIMLLIVWYIINRLLLFDIVWNITKGDLPIDFIGNTSLWDITINKILIKIKMPASFWLWIKFVIWLAYTGAILSKYKL